MKPKKMKQLLQAVGSEFDLIVLTKKEYKNLKKGTTIKDESITPTTLLNYSKIVNMLQEYDTVKLSVDKATNIYSMNALKYEDARMSTFDFDNFKTYISYIEKLAQEKEIKIQGISFVKGTYNSTTAPNKRLTGYESTLYLPTALINGKETLIDLEHSTKDNIVSFKSMLASQGYDWRYDGKDTTQQKTLTINVQAKATDSGSSTGNYNNVTPPLDPVNE